MKYVIDIDGTICKEVIIPDSGGKKDYANHIPMPGVVNSISAVADETVKEEEGDWKLALTSAL